MTEEVDILIYALDDDPDTLELIRRKFERENITNYRMFGSENAFINEFDENVHLTIVDYILGHEKRGLRIVKELNRINPFCYNIIISGHADKDTVIEFFRNGVIDFVSKEKKTYLDDLVGAVRRAVPFIEHRLKMKNKWVGENELY